MSDYKARDILIDGSGKCRFYLGVAADGQPIIGIEHPDSNVRLYITGPVLAQMSGWIARKRKDLKPITIN
jgi:hypothetical protein